MPCQPCKTALGPNSESFRPAVPSPSGKNVEVPVAEQSCSTKAPFLELGEAGVPRISNAAAKQPEEQQPQPGLAQTLHAHSHAAALCSALGSRTIVHLHSLLSTGQAEPAASTTSASQGTAFKSPASMAHRRRLTESKRLSGLLFFK